MVFKNLCILVLWTKVASALEGLIDTGQQDLYAYIYNTPRQQDKLDPLESDSDSWGLREHSGFNPYAASGYFDQCKMRQKSEKFTETLAYGYLLI